MKQKKPPLRQVLFIALFVGLLGLAFPIFNIFSKQLSMDNHENRFLTALPDVLNSPPMQLPAALDAFCNDNSPFRYQLTMLNAEINYRVFHSIDSDQVLLGKDGWLFYKTGPDASCPLADYQGVLAFTEEQLAQYAAAIQTLSDALAAEGKTLVLNYTPNKDTIYPQYVPDGYPVRYPDRLTDQAAAYMQAHTTAAVIYTRPEVEAHAGDMQLYYKYDTHWNKAGALMALDPVLAYLGLETYTFDEYAFVQDGGQQGDMANVSALYRILPPEPEYRPSHYDFAKDGRSVHVFGDSFSEYYMDYLRARFAAVERTPLTEISMDGVLSAQSDIVLIECNERGVQVMFALLCPDADTVPHRR